MVTTRRGYRIRMHQPEGRLIGLIDILSLIRSPDLTWHMRFLWATTRRESDLKVLELEQRIEDSERGVFFSQAELQAVADQFEQVIDMDLLGFPEGNDGATDVGSVVRAEALDSSVWDVTFDEAVVELDHELLAELGAELQSD